MATLLSGPSIVSSNFSNSLILGVIPSADQNQFEYSHFHDQSDFLPQH